MKARFVNESIKHLTPRSPEEINKAIDNTINDLHKLSMDPYGEAEELKFYLENIYSDRKKLINDLIDEGLDPNDLLIMITDDLDISPVEKQSFKHERQKKYKLLVMSWMFDLIQKNKDKIDLNDLDLL